MRDEEQKKCQVGLRGLGEIRDFSISFAKELQMSASFGLSLRMSPAHSSNSASMCFSFDKNLLAS
jgi:hypothetical protein